MNTSKTVNALCRPGVSQTAVAKVAVAVALGYRTTATIAAASGLSPSQTHKALHLLRQASVVGFVDERKGTIHSNFKIVEGFH